MEPVYPEPRFGSPPKGNLHAGNPVYCKLTFAGYDSCLNHCVQVAEILSLHYCAALSLQDMCLVSEIHWLQTLKHSTSCA